MRKILLILIFICICVGVYSALKYKNIVDENKKSDLEYSSQIELYEKINPNNKDDCNYLSECLEINFQTVAWLEIPDTNINFPIVQSDDNEYYLNHDFEGNISVNGVPFLDYRCNSDFSGFNSIIYGHNIKGRNMFADLTEFKNEEFFNSHSYGILTTNNQKYKINFVACLVLQNDDFVYNAVFLNSNEKEIFIKNLKEKSMFYRDFKADTEKNKFVVLSTCSYEFENARTVLAGYLSE